MRKPLLAILLIALIAVQAGAVYSAEGKAAGNDTALASAQAGQYHDDGSITVSNENGYAINERVQAVEISPDGLEVQEEGKLMLPFAIESNAINAEVNAGGELKQVRITQQNQFVVLEANGVQANTTQTVQLQEREMLVAQQKLQIMPDEAKALIQEKLRAQVQSMELVAESNELAYKARVLQQKRLLWVFQVQFEGDAVLNDETGEVTAPKGPWYSFLFTE